MLSIIKSNVSCVACVVAVNVTISSNNVYTIQGDNSKGDYVVFTDGEECWGIRAGKGGGEVEKVVKVARKVGKVFREVWRKSLREG